MNWLTKLKEKAQEHTILGLFALIALLSLIVWRAVPSEAWDKVSEVTPKRALWALLGLLAITAILECAYIVDLRRKQKLKPRFGVYWDRNLTPHCPGCSKLLAYLRYPKDVSGVWGFKCVQCPSFIPLNDDSGQSIEFTEAKRLLSSPSPLPEPDLDEIDMRVLTILAEDSSSGVTAEQFAAVLNLHPEHAKHRLMNLSKRKYIYPSVQWAASSTGPAHYHLNTKGRALLVERQLI